MVRQDTYDPGIEAVLKADLENVVSLSTSSTPEPVERQGPFDLVA